MFAVSLRSEHYVLGSRQQSQTGDGQLPRNDNYHHPGRNPSQPDERDEGGTNHNFVRQWIHQDSEVRNQFAPARDSAVEEIADPRCAKQDERNRFMVG